MTRTELAIVTVGVATLAVLADLLRHLGPDGIVAACCAAGLVVVALHPRGRAICASAWWGRP